jgi:hypothetical protein
MRWILAVALVSLPCLADEAELFVDRGETYVRAGTNAGLDRGTSLEVVVNGKRIGVATVMEAWPAMARVNIDEGARKDASANRRVVLPAKVGGPPPAAPTTPATPTAPPPPPPSSGPRAPLPAGQGALPAPVPAGGPLMGHATWGGVGRWKMVRVFNEGTFKWSRCVLTLLPSNQNYSLADLRDHDQESIAWSNFKPEPGDVEPTSVRVHCAEGDASFPFNP